MRFILKHDFHITYKRLTDLAVQPLTHCVLLQVKACSGVN